MEQIDIKKAILWLVMLVAVITLLVFPTILAARHMVQTRKAQQAALEREVIEWYIDQNRAPYSQYETYEEYMRDSGASE